MYNKILDLFHDMYSLYYCINVVFFTFYLINDNIVNVKVFKNIYDYSNNYFFTSIILNSFQKHYLYVIHHVLTLLNLHIIYYYNNIILVKFANTWLLAEISTLFLSLSKIIKFYMVNKKKKKILNKLKTVSDFCFVISFFSIRMFYILPYTFNLIYNNKFDNISDAFIIYLSSFIGIIMNIYWSWKIIARIKKKYD